MKTTGKRTMEATMEVMADTFADQLVHTAAHCRLLATKAASAEAAGRMDDRDSAARLALFYAGESAALYDAILTLHNAMDGDTAAQERRSLRAVESAERWACVANGVPSPRTARGERAETVLRTPGLLYL